MIQPSHSPSTHADQQRARKVLLLIGGIPVAMMLAATRQAMNTQIMINNHGDAVVLGERAGEGSGISKTSWWRRRPRR